MISENYKFLFIHIPKTGGNSLQTVLETYSEDRLMADGAVLDGVDRFGVQNAKHKNLSKHSTLPDYEAAYGAAHLKGFFKFTTIRNPWDRVMSSYFSPHRARDGWDRDEFVAAVKKMPSIPDYLEKRWKRALFGERRAFGRVDAFLRFENLQDDFDRVMKQLGLPVTPLPVKNKGGVSDYSKYYDPELVDLVGRLFRPEIEFGEYSFPG